MARSSTHNEVLMLIPVANKTAAGDFIYNAYLAIVKTE